MSIGSRTSRTEMMREAVTRVRYSPTIASVSSTRQRTSLHFGGHCRRHARLLAACVIGNRGRASSGRATATPIKHVVVIFGENTSFDDYFGTYPNATNPPGQAAFTAVPNTPRHEKAPGDRWSPGASNFLKPNDFQRAGDGTRTHDVQLGKLILHLQLLPPQSLYVPSCQHVA